MERDELNGLHIEETGLDLHHILNDFDMDAELNKQSAPTSEEMDEMAERFEGWGYENS